MYVILTIFLEATISFFFSFHWKVVFSFFIVLFAQWKALDAPLNGITIKVIINNLFSGLKGWGVTLCHISHDSLTSFRSIIISLSLFNWSALDKRMDHYLFLLSGLINLYCSVPFGIFGAESYQCTLQHFHSCFEISDVLLSNWQQTFLLTI